MLYQQKTYRIVRYSDASFLASVLLGFVVGIVTLPFALPRIWRERRRPPLTEAEMREEGRRKMQALFGFRPPKRDRRDDDARP